MHHGEYKVNVIGVLIFVYRPLTYVSSLMVQLVYVHSTKCLSAFKAGNYVKFMSVMHVPNYLFSWQDAADFVRILSLVSMLILMPFCGAWEKPTIFLTRLATRLLSCSSRTQVSQCPQYLLRTPALVPRAYRSIFNQPCDP